MKINNLLPLQDGLRLSEEAFREMCHFVVEGGFFDKGSLMHHDPQSTGLIVLVQTEDGNLWIRDGLHRICAIGFPWIHQYYFNKSVERELREDEYEIEYRTYEQFQTINPACGWVTPFDPRTEVRRADFFHFKQQALQLIRDGIDPTRFIMEHRHDYCVPRSHIGCFGSGADIIRQYLPQRVSTIASKTMSNVFSEE